MNLRMVVAEVPNLRLMAETQQPLIIPDVSVFPGWLDFPERWLRSYAGRRPVLIDGQIAGYVNLDSATPGFFHSTHTSRLQAFANRPPWQTVMPAYTNRPRSRPGRCLC